MRNLAETRLPHRLLFSLFLHITPFLGRWSIKVEKWGTRQKNRRTNKVHLSTFLLHPSLFSIHFSILHISSVFRYPCCYCWPLLAVVYRALDECTTCELDNLGGTASDRKTLPKRMRMRFDSLWGSRFSMYNVIYSDHLQIHCSQKRVK